MKNIMNKDTHVYCTNCINIDSVLKCIESETEDCSNCPCNGCECRNPEDSFPFIERPKYKEKVQNELIINRPSFNTKYFKPGEAIKVKFQKSSQFIDALVVKTEKDILRVVTVEWNSPMCGSARYEPEEHNIWIDDVVNGLIKVEKYA